MSERSPLWRRAIGAMNSIALGVIGNLATDALKSLPPGPVRDVVLPLVWPLVIVGIIAIALAVILSERPSRASPGSLAVNASPSPQITDEQRELAELRAKERAAWRRNRLEGHRQMADEWIARCSSPDAPALAIETKTNAYGALVALDQAVRETLTDVPLDQSHYDDPLREENLAKIIWSALPWHEHVVVMFKIRRSAISDLLSRLP